MTTFIPQFQMGQMVYSRIVSDGDGPPKGMVTGILIRPIGPAYYVTWEDGNERLHYAMELTVEKPEKEFSAGFN